MKWHCASMVRFSFLFGSCFSFEVILSRDTTHLKVCGVILSEVCNYPVIRNIGKIAVISYVFHMPFPLPVVWMKEAVASAVEIEGFYAELIA